MMAVLKLFLAIVRAHLDRRVAFWENPMAPTATVQSPLPIFRPRRLGHVNFFVDNLERATEFYNLTCGLALEFAEVGLKATFLGTGNTPHDVGCIESTKGKDRYGRDGHLQLPKEVGSKPGFNHMAWEIENEVELIASYERCQAAGVTISRLADHQIAHSIYLKDPDGNMNEFYVDTIRDWRSVLHGELDLITSVWDPKATTPSGESLYDPSPEIRVVEEAPFHPQRLASCTLVSNQPDRLAEFYIKIAGLTQVGEREGVYLLAGSRGGQDAHLAILPATNGSKPCLHHFSLELSNADTLEAAELALREKKTPVIRRISGPAKRSIFLADPDGQLVELFCRTSGAPSPAKAPVNDPYSI